MNIATADAIATRNTVQAMRPLGPNSLGPGRSSSFGDRCPWAAFAHSSDDGRPNGLSLGISIWNLLGHVAAELRHVLLAVFVSEGYDVLPSHALLDHLGVGILATEEEQARAGLGVVAQHTFHCFLGNLVVGLHARRRRQSECYACCHAPLSGCTHLTSAVWLTWRNYVLRPCVR